MAYEAIEIAKYIINKCTVDGCPVSNLQIQKILYFLQKHYLQNENTVLFYDDIEAWQFGPVVPEVYYKYCGYGSMRIHRLYNNYTITDIDREKIDTIVEDKRNKRPWELVAETHNAGSAWDRVYHDGSGNHEVIPIGMIKNEV